jgi:membrane associated rhomboid family serine protease
MLEDRYYMREPEFQSRSPYLMLIVIFCVNLGFFILSQIHLAYQSLPFVEELPLNPAELKQGYVWQLLTYQFLHFGRWHFVLNMIMLYLFGRPVIEALGNKHFTIIYLASGFVGGILQSILGWIFPNVFGLSVVGASAGVFGIIAAFATIDPNGEMMWFFVLRMKNKVFLWIATGIAVFYILVPAITERHIAHAAHLGGIIVGYLYIRYSLHHRSFSFRFNWHPLRTRARRRELVKAATLKPGFWKAAKGQQVEDVEPEEFISREVDPILDKISAHGIQSLTPREKQILEAARTKMDKR